MATVANLMRGGPLVTLPVLLSVAREHWITWHQERPHITIHLDYESIPYGAIELRVDPTGYLDEAGQAQAKALFHALCAQGHVWKIRAWQGRRADQASVYEIGFTFSGVRVAAMPSILEQIQAFAAEWTRPIATRIESLPAESLRRYLGTL